LSFSIAFAARRWLADFFTLLAPAMLLLAGGMAMLSGGEGLVLSAGTSLIMLFCVAVSLHSRLYSLRPDNDRLTFFYLVMAVGGVLGGLFCALFAPLAFDWVYEHPILVVAAALLLPLPPLIPWADYLHLPHQWHRIISLVLAVIAASTGYWLGHHWTGQIGNSQIIAIAAIAFCGLAAIGWRLAFVTALCALMYGFGGLETLNISLDGDRTRSYFGVYTLREHDGQRTLSHGTTLHGTQLLGTGLSRTRTSYYGPYSGVGLAFDRANRLYGNAARIGVVGLGTGTLSCYRQAGQDWTIYEIDPAMAHLARNSGRFTYLAQCAPDAPIIIGDARLKLQERSAASLDLLAVDAFSSDAIPLHLLTREAFDVYGRAVQQNGVVLVHISNRFVNLEPVLKALVSEDGWHAMLRYDMPDASDYALARTGSIWVAMSRNQGAIDRLIAASADAPNGRGLWRPLDPAQPGRLWTDDYASVMPLLMEPDFVHWIKEKLGL
ncbi:MAG: fused MFS/spermidine synthase, partial [Sphingopyxis sp.]